MKLNSIQCRDYSAGERFFAVLQNCTENDIRAIDPTALIISADDGTAAETYSSYGRLYSIKHLLSDGSYEVEFEHVSKTEVLAGSICEKAEIAKKLSVLLFRLLAQNGTVEDSVIVAHAEVFPDWTETYSGKSGSIVRHDGVLYRCGRDVDGDTAAPSNKSKVWSKIGEVVEKIAAWVQPTGAHDAYALGAEVTHNGKTWGSTVDSNVWEPGVYGLEEKEN